MSDPFISDRRHWEKARINQRHVADFPLFGYIDGFEVRFLEPQPNVNAQVGMWRAIIEVIGPLGERPDFEVIGSFREIERLEEASKR